LNPSAYLAIVDCFNYHHHLFTPKLVSTANFSAGCDLNDLVHLCCAALVWKERNGDLVQVPFVDRTVLLWFVFFSLLNIMKLCLRTDCSLGTSHNDGPGVAS